jgi:hypothetical protein
MSASELRSAGDDILTYASNWGEYLLAISGLVLAVTGLARVRRVDWEQDVPPKLLDRCFAGEGLRLLKALRSSGDRAAEGVWGEFTVPKDASGRPEILAVGSTLAEVEERLPQQWKESWRRVSR